MMNIIRLYFIVLISALMSSGLLAAEYKVAVRAHHGIDRAHKQWQSTLDALNAKLPSHKFTLLPIISLDEISLRGSRNEFDFILTNPSSVVEFEVLYGAKTLLTLNNKRAKTSQSRFGSVIFTHVRNPGIISLEDLKDKTLMAVSEPAFGGWRVAWLEMLEQGFDPEKDLKKLVFTESKTQPEVVYAVRDRKVDAGVVRTDRLERMETAGEIDLRYFRVLNNKDIKGFPFFLSTELYPEWGFAAMNSVPEELSQQVKNILLALPPTSKAANDGKYIGWISALDYRSVKELMKQLKVGPYTN